MSDDDGQVRLPSSAAGCSAGVVLVGCRPVLQCRRAPTPRGRHPAHRRQRREPHDRVTLPDGSVPRDARAAPPGASSPSRSGPAWPGGAGASGSTAQVRDLDRPLEDDATVAILTERDPEALEVLRHSAAHILATAVRELFPTAGIGFGPPIEDGFYYDFEVDRAVHAGGPRADRGGDGRGRRSGTIRSCARWWTGRRPTGGSPTIRSSSSGSPSWAPTRRSRVYTDGPFADLCRGPHVPSTGRLKHFKLLSRRRRLLARRRAPPDAAAHLRHGLVQEGGPRRAPPPAGGGAQARPSACWASELDLFIVPSGRRPGRPSGPTGEPIYQLAALRRAVEDGSAGGYQRDPDAADSSTRGLGASRGTGGSTGRTCSWCSTTEPGSRDSRSSR